MLINLFKSGLILILLTLCVNAQSSIQKAETSLDQAISSQTGKDMVLMSAVVIGSKKYAALSVHDFRVLSSTAKLVNTLKANQFRNKNLDKYAEKTASVLRRYRKLN